MLFVLHSQDVCAYEVLLAPSQKRLFLERDDKMGNLPVTCINRPPLADGNRPFEGGFFVSIDPLLPEVILHYFRSDPERRNNLSPPERNCRNKFCRNRVIQIQK